jgi:hypothetical protein
MSNVEQITKTEGEIITLYFDAKSKMFGTEEAVTAICSSVILVGEDSGAENVVYGDCTVVNGVVAQPVQGGVAGCVYLITCAVRTSLNNIPMFQSALAVLPGETLDPAEI